MIMSDPSQKVTADHLRRDAYLYIRQSTLRQVLENSESTKRQYALRQRAIALGWPDERIVVIDSDLGQSGASAADREGFQKLVAEVRNCKRISYRICPSDSGGCCSSNPRETCCAEC